MFSLASKLSPSSSVFSSFTKTFIESSYVPVRYAARKGTRERKQKKKVKKEVVVKPKFVPHNLRNRDLLLAKRPLLKFDDSARPVPVDDVYAIRNYRLKVYPFDEAVEAYRETHHPDIYNAPNSNLFVRIELNMQAEKVTRFVEDFTRVVAIPHKFDLGEERAILAFGKTVASQNEALDAGAQLAGGVDLIKQIQNGAVSLLNFKYIVAHPDILPELVPLRGLLKKRFPNPKMGTLDVDLGSVTDKFINGISYSAKKDEHEKDFGLIQTVIGKLTMDSKQLEENFAAVVRDVITMKPRREGHFISRCLLVSPPSPDQLKVDHGLYIEDETKDKPEEGEKAEEEGERVAL